MQTMAACHRSTAMHGTVLQVIRRVEGLGHRIFMDNYFTLPALFGDLFQRKISVCATVRHDKSGMPRDIVPKSLKMKRGDIVTRIRGTLRAVRWKDRGDVYILINMHAPPVEGNFTQESGQALKPRVVEDYNAYMGVCGQVRQNGQQLWNCPQNMEVDQETVFSPNRHDHSKRISKSSVVCVRCTSKHGSVTICA